MASRLLAAEVLEKVPITAEHSIVELAVPKSWVGQSLEALQLRERFRVIVVAIERHRTGVDDQGNPTREERLVVPGGPDVLQRDDVLLLVGRNTDLEALRVQD